MFCSFSTNINIITWFYRMHHTPKHFISITGFHFLQCGNEVSTFCKISIMKLEIQRCIQKHPEACGISQTQLSVEIVNGFRPLTILKKGSILDVLTGIWICLWDMLGYKSFIKIGIILNAEHTQKTWQMSSFDLM